MAKKPTIKEGLNPTPQDNRDLLVGSIFKSINIEDVPNDDFIVAKPLRIKDQGDSDLCSAFTVTSVSEDQEGIELSPEYQFAKTKDLMGEWTEWGADLRMACKSVTKKGSIPDSKSPYKLLVKTRDFIANWTNWDRSLDEIALKHSKDSYMRITGRYDHFDNIRAWMWQFRDERRSVATGAMWKMEWLDGNNGIVPKGEFQGGFGHAFKIFGQKNIDGELHLVAQLSNGKNIGDNGIFYLPREVINENVERFGAYMFKDISPEKLRFYQENNVRIGGSNLSIAIAKIINFIKNLL